VKLGDLDYPAARSDAEKALAFDPDNSDALNFYSIVLDLYLGLLKKCVDDAGRLRGEAICEGAPGFHFSVLTFEAQRKRRIDTASSTEFQSADVLYNNLNYAAAEAKPSLRDLAGFGAGV